MPNMKKADALASEILTCSREELLAVMPYMDRVLLNLPVILHDPESDPLAEIGFGTDGREIHTFAGLVIETYYERSEKLNRLLFHTLLHCLFDHMFPRKTRQEEIWNLSTDMAVENLILGLHFSQLTIAGDDRRREILSDLFPDQKYRHAEALYGFMIEQPDLYQQASAAGWLFHQDRHDLWYPAARAKNSPETRKNQKQWAARRKQVEQEAHHYENARGLTPGTVVQKLHLQEKKYPDMRELLTRFIADTEVQHTDPDSFDLLLYTYGLDHYHDMPLIEPLEASEQEEIHDFVIAIDTSASCSEKKIRFFLEETGAVLESSYFKDHFNVHIIQCDAAVQQETVLSSLSDFQAYIQNMKIKGRGGTDYRPVFARVKEEMQEGVFQNLRGLIYFTDGNGTYPVEVPSYQTAFVIDPASGQKLPEVPPWIVRIEMNGEIE